MSIKSVETFGTGDEHSRRLFLEKLSVGAFEGIAALTMTGRSEGSIGIESNKLPNHPFGTLGGYVEHGKLFLPSGCAVSLGVYGNPIIDPAPIHGASLQAMSPEIFDQGSLWRNIMRSKEEPTSQQISDFVRGMRLFQILVKDNGGYRRWDLSAPSFEPPVVRVGSDGSLEVTEGGKVVVSKNDGYYLRLVYHEDVNRFDRSAVIGVFEQSQPPSTKDPILAAELDTPLIVSEQLWGVTDQGSLIRPDEIQGDLQPGVKLIRAGDNLWRYAYEDGKFSAECRRHGGRPDEEWDAMGQPVFYQLTQRGLDTLLVPEPDLRKALDLGRLDIEGIRGHATGIVLWSVSDGTPKIERKSLTNLQNNGGTVVVSGNRIEWTEAGKPPRQFQIVELRNKPLTDQGTYDLYAVELTAGMERRLPSQPIVHGVGQFDMVRAYRAAQAVLRT